MYLRQLPSGKWQATVRLPDGKKTTHTHQLKSVVRTWADQVEEHLKRGEVFDLEASSQTLNQWYTQWIQARVVAPATRQRNESQWRVHVQPRWGDVPINRIKRLQVQGWIKELDKTLGARSVEGAYHLLSSMMSAAVSEGLIPISPCREISLPKSGTKRLRFFTKDECARILAELDEPFRTMVDLGMHTGMRMGELTGLDASAIDFLRRQIHVWQVNSRYGLRDYPKSKRSNRVVPVPDHVLDALGRLPKTGLVFTGPQGGAIEDTNFNRRVWTPALKRAGVPHASPHTMRHTAASWLVQSGIDLYRVSALLGHESPLMTQRYAHLAPNAHDEIRDAWSPGASAAHAREIRKAYRKMKTENPLTE
jgi:hypothetical protein